MIESNSREREILAEKDSSCLRPTSGTFAEDEPSSIDSLVDRKRKTRGSLREVGWDKSKRTCSEKETKDEIKSSPIHRMREYCRLHNALFTRDKDVAGLIYKFNMKQVKSYLVESLETDLETVLSIVPWGIPRGKYAALARAINFVIGRAHPDASQVTEEEARKIVVPTRVGYEVRFQVLSDLGLLEKLTTKAYRQVNLLHEDHWISEGLWSIFSNLSIRELLCLTETALHTLLRHPDIQLPFGQDEHHVLRQVLDGAERLRRASGEEDRFEICPSGGVPSELTRDDELLNHAFDLWEDHRPSDSQDLILTSQWTGHTPCLPAMETVALPLERCPWDGSCVPTHPFA